MLPIWSGQRAVCAALAVCLAMDICAAETVEKALASCALIQLDNPRQEDSMRAPAVYATQRSSPLDQYRRGFGAEWLVPNDVDACDSTVRLLLLTPDGPLVIDVDVRVDGKPYRAPRESWIDDAFANAGNAGAEAETAPPAGEDNETDYRSPGSKARLARYLAALGGPIERAEARWLLAQWTPGPALLELRDGFGRERAAQAPLLTLLDTNGDGSLTTSELDAAAIRLRRADVDENDIVDLAEIRRQTSSTINARDAWLPTRLFEIIEGSTVWKAVADRVASAYPHAPALASQLQEQANATADLSLAVSLGESESSPAGVMLTQMAPALGSAEQVVVEADRVISLALPGATLEISAAAGSTNLGQISCGAIVDGFPLWRYVDADADGRLSPREEQRAPQQLAALDTNNDGALAAHEIPTAIRFAVAAGPQVHRILERPSSAVARARSNAATHAPDWFTAMDANHDGDLARSEFFGTSEQFQQMDIDADGLLSAGEAQAGQFAN